MKGLCNGRLFSCAGHLVSPQLPKIIATGKANMISMFRHPWNRLQSDYHYLRSKPESRHLGEDFNVSELLQRVHGIIDFIKYPGISNCATKMLNGIQCADDVHLNDSHLSVAKTVIDSMLWFGITENYRTSLCQFSWMYGGYPTPFHSNKFREGSYVYLSMEEALSPQEIEIFKFTESYDIAIYEYARDIFEHRRQITRCPMVDN